MAVSQREIVLAVVFTACASSSWLMPRPLQGVEYVSGWLEIVCCLRLKSLVTAT